MATPVRVEMQCRSSGCFKLARWKCMVVMPRPPGMPAVGVAEGDRQRIFSGVCVCDVHRKDATIGQVLGPMGYQALTFAFKKLGKKAPARDDLGVDFESLEHAPILSS